MTDKNKALEDLADAYLARGEAQARVRAKYANYHRELEEAKQEDIDRVAGALVSAWNAGASVAATGRAMGAANIYNARRVYYSRAREMEGAEDNELLDRLFKRARGEEHGPNVAQGGAGVAPGKYEDEQEQEQEQEPDGTDDLTTEGLDLHAWVNSWTLEPIEDGNWAVNDPQGRVDSIRLGYINGFKGENLAEFLKDKELADMVTAVHGIETKVRN